MRKQNAPRTEVRREREPPPPPHASPGRPGGAPGPLRGMSSAMTLRRAARVHPGGESSATTPARSSSTPRRCSRFPTSEIRWRWQREPSRVPSLNSPAPAVLPGQLSSAATACGSHVQQSVATADDAGELYGVQGRQQSCNRRLLFSVCMFVVWLPSFFSASLFLGRRQCGRERR